MKTNVMNFWKSNSDSNAIREKVIETITRVLGPHNHPGKSRLELTSLQMLELIVALEEEFEIHIPEDAPLTRITSSVDAIVKYLGSLALPAK